MIIYEYEIQPSRSNVAKKVKNLIKRTAFTGLLFLSPLLAFFATSPGLYIKSSYQFKLSFNPPISSEVIIFIHYLYHFYILMLLTFKLLFIIVFIASQDMK